MLPWFAKQSHEAHIWGAGEELPLSAFLLLGSLDEGQDADGHLPLEAATQSVLAESSPLPLPAGAMEAAFLS